MSQQSSQQLTITLEQIYNALQTTQSESWVYGTMIWHSVGLKGHGK